MKGHMRERSGGWELRVSAGRDSVTGRKRYLTRTVRAGKREAQRALAALIVEAGQNGAPCRGTFAELLEEWFAHAEPDFSPKTAAETRRILDRTVIPRLGDRRVDKLRPSDLDALYGELRTTGGRAGRSLAPATVRRIHVKSGRAADQLTCEVPRGTRRLDRGGAGRELARHRRHHPDFVHISCQEGPEFRLSGGPSGRRSRAR
jgi:integrase